ncbi:hypothetical protein [Streptomyces sp. NPDC048551]|uniref:hypothetical protein n=1 Tax=Streptomyces sp. NPDC048551 TaxID=3155758 RepID=UPI0034464602
MDGEETSASTRFEYEYHPLLHHLVRDPVSGREGHLVVVVRTALGYVDGQLRTGLTGYVRRADGTEFTAAVATLEDVS